MPELIEHGTEVTALSAKRDVQMASRSAQSEGKLQKIADLFGGYKYLRYAVNSPLDAHDLVLRGLPAVALYQLIANLVLLDRPDVLQKALGMSIRTVQRRKETPDKQLNQEQSGRAWAFAEVLAKATDVLGSQEEAERWIERPAIGLNQRRPIDLMATPVGLEAVKTYLERLDYGVYT